MISARSLDLATLIFTFVGGSSDPFPVASYPLPGSEAGALRASGNGVAAPSLWVDLSGGEFWGYDPVVFVMNNLTHGCSSYANALFRRMVWV
jgi:hypothetical protein